MSNPGMRQLGRMSVLSQLWQRLQAMPPPQTENSLWLRVLVQALVIVGIIATDITTTVYSDQQAQIPISLWAVPLSIVGATWSWYRRRDRNIAVKFFLAIGMLLAMGVFFRNLLANLNDTRLALAQLLIQVQVLHSFDLPRRKDLGYSMVIGLILLGVAGTLSQTLAFAPVLLVFLAIALPVLVLDYQSRLGISQTPKRQLSRRSINYYTPLSPRRLGVFLLVIIGLGLAIFAVMPRFPGYQIQTFPMSAPDELKNLRVSQESRGIVNRGYDREGNPNASSGSGGNLSGKMDETFYYGFGSKINQNLWGELKPKVVMRVRSQAPGFWRVLAFDRYTGQGWEISRDEQLMKLERPEWSYRFQLYPTNFNISRTKQVIQSYTAVSDLPNIIPALAYPREIYFPTKELEVDAEGSLRSPLGLPEGLTYTVISDVPLRDRTRLQQAADNYPNGIKKYYLDLPPAIADQVRQKAEALLATSPKPITSSYEKALYLTQELKRRYRIPDNPFGARPLQENEDLVETFLFKNEGGYPDHFSTTLTIMLRAIGIPARLVVGFGTGQFNPFTGFYIVKNTDAYAMTEVYFPKYGWFAFDPIPGHELLPESVEDTEAFGVLRQFWNWVAGWLPTPVRNGIADLWNLIIGSLIKVVVWLWRILSSGWLGLFVGLVLAIAVGFLGWLGWGQWQDWRYRRWLSKLPPMERLYQQMLKFLGMKGYIKHPAQTPLEYASRMRQHQPPAAEVIEEISHAYVRWRYGAVTPNIQQLQLRFRELVKSNQRLGK